MTLRAVLALTLTIIVTLGCMVANIDTSESTSLGSANAHYMMKLAAIKKIQKGEALNGWLYDVIAHDMPQWVKKHGY